MNSIIEVALAYAEKGFLVFPCKGNKKPFTLHGYKEATTDIEQIKRWWTLYPDAMIGFPTGAINRVWVLDVDRPKKPEEFDGNLSLAELVRQFGPLPDTWTQTTPSGGTHYIFAYPQDGLPIPNTSNQIAKKLDVRGDGGYIIMAPSKNSNGGGYNLSKNYPAVLAPDWLVALVRESKKSSSYELSSFAKQDLYDGVCLSTAPYAAKALEEECRKVREAQEGARNDTLVRAAFSLGTLIGGGELDENLVCSRLMEAVNAMLSPLPTVEAERTISSGISSGKMHPRTAPKTITSETNVSEESIASSFAGRYRESLRYCKDWGCWLIWNPERYIWEVDNKKKVFHFIREECKRNNPSNKASLGKAGTAQGVEKFCCADPLFSTTNDDWDSDIFLLGTPSGVISLK